VPADRVDEGRLVMPEHCQHSDLPLLLGDLLSLLGDLLVQSLHFATQALVLAAQRLIIRRGTPWQVRSSMRGSQRLLNI
jgi:hypothetical protein